MIFKQKLDPIARCYARLGIAAAFAGLVVSTPTPTAAENTSPAPTKSQSSSSSCGGQDYTGISKPAKRIASAKIRYPQRELSEMGEGWVQLDYTISSEGIPVDFRVVDALGDPIFGVLAADGYSKARFEPAQIDGKPVVFNFLHLEVFFQVEGPNRVGIHPEFDRNTDRAQRFRKEGKFADSLASLREILKLKLNLYERATTAFGLAVTYVGLNDRRRALKHIRHATIDAGSFADRGLRENALAMRAELEGRDGNPVDALCAFQDLKEQYPNHPVSPALQSVIDRARSDLEGKMPLRHEIELVETERPDIQPMWYHPLVRRSFKIEGAAKSFRLVCPTVVMEKLVSQPIDVKLDESAGWCNLYVSGDAGAKFTLEER